MMLKKAFKTEVDDRDVIQWLIHDLKLPVSACIGGGDAPTAPGQVTTNSSTRNLEQAYVWEIAKQHLLWDNGEVPLSSIGLDRGRAGLVLAWVLAFWQDAELALYAESNFILWSPSTKVLISLTIRDDFGGSFSPKHTLLRCALYACAPAIAQSLAHSMVYPVAGKERTKPQVHLMTMTGNHLDLISTTIKQMKLADHELDMYYGAGFRAWHDELFARIVKRRDGLAVLHGPPGGGKTTYIRHLIRLLMTKRRVILVPRAVLEVLGTPNFVSFLLDLDKEPTILIIEDAEDVVSIDSRGMGAATSTLLNLTDGLLNDVAGVQALVTFNCPVAKVDPALLRPGRLLGIREFGPLTATEARTLGAAKGVSDNMLKRIVGPTMLAEVLAEEPAVVAGAKELTGRHQRAGF